MTTVKITTVGSSSGIVLPKEVLQKLRASKGDRLQVIELPDGVKLTSYDPAFEQQLEVAEGVMRQDRDVLRKLAR